MTFVNRASWDKGSSFCKVCGKDTKQKGGRHHWYFFQIFIRNLLISAVSVELVYAEPAVKEKLMTRELATCASIRQKLQIEVA